MAVVKSICPAAGPLCSIGVLSLALAARARRALGPIQDT